MVEIRVSQLRELTLAQLVDGASVAIVRVFTREALQALLHRENTGATTSVRLLKYQYFTF
jgi:hypothetical protein